MFNKPRIGSTIPYLALLIRPAILGVVAVIIWYYSRSFIQVPVTDQGVLQSVLAIIGMAHGFIAAMQIERVAEQNRKIRTALIIKNKEMFDENSCTTIHPVIKLLLAIFSILFVVVFIHYPFSSSYTGILTVWTVIFVLYLLWEVASELDDPYHGIWNITHEKYKQVFGEGA